MPSSILQIAIGQTLANKSSVELYWNITLGSVATAKPANKYSY